MLDKMTTTMKANCLKRKWMILFAAFYGNFCSAGLIFNMSVLYVEWLEAFEESGAKTALVQSVCTGLATISGVIFGMLLSRFGARIIGISSGILLTLGFILSCFASDLVFLILLLSVPAGLGASGVYHASMAAVQQYFDGKQKHTKLSIASFGSGVGGTVFTYVLNYFSLQYGWRGCMLILGGVLLHTVPFFTLCRPLGKPNFIDTNNKSCTQVGGGNVGNMQWLTNLMRDFKQIITTKLFLINLVGVIILQAIAAPFVILIDSMQEKGFSREEVVLSYMALSICASVSRLVPSVLKYIPHVSIFGIALVVSLVGTATFLALPSVHSFSWNIVAMCCIGSCYGATIGGILPVTVSTTVRQQHFSLAFGIAGTAFGTELLLVLPFNGYLRDTTGSYDAVFYATGSAECLSILMFIIALELNRKRNNQSNIRNTDDKKQSEEGSTSTSNIYDNLSFETYL